MSSVHSQNLVDMSSLLYRVNNAHKIIRDTLISQKWIGYDPFDGLNCLAGTLTPEGRFKLLKISLLQFHKRFGFNTRPLFRIKKTCNPKTLALSLLGEISLIDHGLSSDVSEILINRILKLKNNYLDSGGWGYPFPWQARAFYSPAHQPNVIATSYCILALDKAESKLNTVRQLEQVYQDAGRFIDRFLFSKTCDGKPYFRYVPNSDAHIHNASLWGATTLLTIGNKLGNKNYCQKAIDAIHTSIDYQQDDGSWIYGLLDHHRFIDSFHSGYILEALHIAMSLHPSDEILTSFQKGFEYFKNFINDSGEVSYYANSKWPLDSHCYAQAIITLGLSNKTDVIPMLEKVVENVMSLMWLESKGRFIYQRHKMWTNRCNYMRWTQAWMLRAMADWLAKQIKI